MQLGIFLFGSLYFFVPVLGIGLNSYVLCRLSKIARYPMVEYCIKITRLRQSTLRFKTSSALPLAAMSFSDSVCLFAQLCQAIFHFAARLHYADTLGEPWSSGFCKVWGNGDEFQLSSSSICTLSIRPVHSAFGAGGCYR